MGIIRNIAIVEDEDDAAEKLKGYIARYGEQNGSEFNIVRFANAADFIEQYRSDFAVVFMDIQMPKMNGMDVAERLRKRDKTVSIIFITNLVQYARRGYEVDAVGFLVKPVSYYDFSLKFGKALDLYVVNEKRDFTINTPGELVRISTDKLMYVEILNHRLYYHLIDDVVEMTGVLSEAESNLAEYGFLRCNKCYLVNPRFVVSVKGQEVTVGNCTLAISRPRRAEFLTGLAKYFSGQSG